MDYSANPSRSSALSIIALSVALIGVGIIAVFTTGASLDRPILRPEWIGTLAGRQLEYAAAGLAAMLLAYRIGAGWAAWRRGALFQPALLLFAVTLALLALVFVPGIGHVSNGAQRWIKFGGVVFQPSELCKLGMLVFLAAWLTGDPDRGKRFWSGTVPAVLAIGACAALVGLEDLGTAVLLAAVGGCLLIAAGCRWWHLVPMTIPGALGFLWMLYDKPYRIQRFVEYQGAWDEPLDTSSHVVQSLLTIASGGWWGRGLGAGIQKYGYLPASRTDFVFAVICEELGIIGGLAIIAMYVALVWLGRRAVLQAKDEFSAALALGITMLVGLQAAMNIAVVTVSMPTKGIGLPLVSAGGSGLVALSVALGLLAWTAGQGERENAPASTG